jgi:hypothetical protein
MKRLMQAVGTMASARMGNIRAYFEFAHELMAQYIMDGTIRFNPLPDSLTTHHAWGRPQNRWRQDKVAHEQANEDLEYMAQEYMVMCEEIIQRCVGKIFVM